MVDKFLFFYPSTSIGGAQLLMSRTAEFLINKGYNVGILVNEESDKCYIEQYLDLKNCAYEKIYFNAKNKHLGKSSELLIIPLPTVFALNYVFNPKSVNKIFQWDTHPSGAINQLFLGSLYQKGCFLLQRILFQIDHKKYSILKKHLDFSIYNGSLVYMCGSNYRLNKSIFNLNYHPEYLQLPIDKPKDVTIWPREDMNQDRINIAWLGRINDVKSSLIEMVIKDCYNYISKSTVSIHFYIIGDGPLKKHLENKYSYYWLHFVGGMPIDDVPLYYKKKEIKIGFNVGTSALEAGIYGLYSVLLPGLECVDFYKMKKNRYLNLFDANNFDVSIDKYNTNYKKKLKTFDNIIDSFRSDHEGDLLKRTKKYAMLNHRLDMVLIKAEKLFFQSNITYQDLLSADIFYKNSLYKIAGVIRNFKKKLSFFCSIN